jgi:hypothetical protein
MIIEKKAIDRRAILRGIGAALALPFLDAMAPALSAMPLAPRRFGVVYVPNGIMMQNWTPAMEGRDFEFTPILKPLEPFRDRMVVLSGLNSKPTTDSPAVHSRASTRFLTDVPLKNTAGADVQAGISMDQIAAKELCRQTQLASLELALDFKDAAGTADTGLSRAYCNTISWSSAGTPLPMENNPRAVFERLFGDTGSTAPQVRLARIAQERSILDSVTDKINSLEKTLGTSDRAKLGEYLEGVRAAERRIQVSERQGNRQLPVIEHPAGIPPTFIEHAKLMFDLYALAYQCDLTRVVTFMIGQEFTGRTYPEIGVHDGHHATSHHRNDPVKLANLAKINTYHTNVFAYFLNKLRSTPDGDGSLLDHVTLMYGAGMSDGNSHDPKNLPVVLLGAGPGIFKSGGHVRFPDGTPLANLHLTLLDYFGVPIEKLGDSTGEIRTL